MPDPLARLLTLALAGTLAVGVSARRPPAPPSPIPADRARLRNWRDAWLLGLAEARGRGAAGQLVAEGPLLDPDAAGGDPALPDGDYRCRTIKLGALSAGDPAFVAYPAVPCRVAEGRFVMLVGTQRPGGVLLPYDGLRLLFLGAVALGDERAAMPYGRDLTRDVVGFVERIGPGRWRMVQPNPRWQSRIDVTEIVPAG